MAVGVWVENLDKQVITKRNSRQHLEAFMAVALAASHSTWCGSLQMSWCCLLSFSEWCLIYLIGQHRTINLVAGKCVPLYVKGQKCWCSCVVVGGCFVCEFQCQFNQHLLICSKCCLLQLVNHGQTCCVQLYLKTREHMHTDLEVQFRRIRPNCVFRRLSVCLYLCLHCCALLAPYWSAYAVGRTLFFTRHKLVPWSAYQTTFSVRFLMCRVW